MLNIVIPLIKVHGQYLKFPYSSGTRLSINQNLEATLNKIKNLGTALHIETKFTNHLCYYPSIEKT